MGYILCPALCPHPGCSHWSGSACATTTVIFHSQMFHRHIRSKISTDVLTEPSSTSPALAEQDSGRKHLLQRLQHPEWLSELRQNGEQTEWVHNKEASGSKFLLSESKLNLTLVSPNPLCLPAKPQQLQASQARRDIVLTSGSWRPGKGECSSGKSLPQQ